MQFRGKYTGLLFWGGILVVLLFFSFQYDNLSGAGWGDGYFHARFAKQIFLNGTISHFWEGTVFSGEYLDDTSRYAPIFYPQFFHLSLGIFNEIAGLSIFSPFFHSVITLGNFILLYLFFRHYGVKFSSLWALLGIFILSYRLFGVNFIENFMIFYFLFVLYFCLRNFHTHYPFLFIFLLAALGGTKHFGMFESIIFFTILSVFYLFYFRSFVLSILIFLFYCICIVGPYLSLYRDLGAIFYPINLPLTFTSYIPFFSQTQSLLFSPNFSSFQIVTAESLPSVNFLQYLIVSLNHVWNSYTTSYILSTAILSTVLIAISVKSLFMKNYILVIFLICVILFELFSMYTGQLRFMQYNVHLHIVLFILIICSLNKIVNPLRVLVSFFLIFCVFQSFFGGTYWRSYQYTARKTIDSEVLLQDFVYQLDEMNLPRNTLFMTSMDDFYYLSGRDRIWDTYIWNNYDYRFTWAPLSSFEDRMVYFDEKVSKFGIDYLIINSFNLTNRNTYDSLQTQDLQAMIDRDKLKLIFEAQNGIYFMRLYRINSRMSQESSD